jgi:hypothetical protein
MASSACDGIGTGNPRVTWGLPVPVPAKNPYPRSGCGYLQVLVTGMASQTGQENPSDWLLIHLVGSFLPLLADTTEHLIQFPAPLL